MITCVVCGKKKSVSEFYISFSGNPRNQCKKCYSQLVVVRRREKKRLAKEAKREEYRIGAVGYCKNGKRTQLAAHGALNPKQVNGCK